MSAREFTTDWSDSIAHWPAMFDKFGFTGKDDLHFLEIGCFEGRTTLWLLEHVLAAPGSTITVIDPFPMDGQRSRFNRNLVAYLEVGKVRVWPYRSDGVLRLLRVEDRFDFIYVDGDHTPSAALADAVLAWPHLKPGGLMVFDDYDWPEMPADRKPTIAIDAFVACYTSRIAARGRCGRDQYFVEKAAA